MANPRQNRPQQPPTPPTQAEIAAKEEEARTRAWKARQEREGGFRNLPWPVQIVIALLLAGLAIWAYWTVRDWFGPPASVKKGRARVVAEATALKPRFTALETELDKGLTAIDQIAGKVPPPNRLAADIWEEKLAADLVETELTKFETAATSKRRALEKAKDDLDGHRTAVKKVEEVASEAETMEKVDAHEKVVKDASDFLKKTEKSVKEDIESAVTLRNKVEAAPPSGKTRAEKAEAKAQDDRNAKKVAADAGKAEKAARLKPIGIGDYEAAKAIFQKALADRKAGFTRTEPAYWLEFNGPFAALAAGPWSLDKELEGRAFLQFSRLRKPKSTVADPSDEAAVAFFQFRTLHAWAIELEQEFSEPVFKGNNSEAELKRTEDRVKKELHLLEKAWTAIEKKRPK